MFDDDTPAGRAGRAALQAYLAAVPEPTTQDFSCSRCKARPGQPCVRPDGRLVRPHAPRQDRYVRAANGRQLQAILAGDGAYSAAVYRAQGLSARQIARMISKGDGEAYLVAKGWRPAGRRWVEPRGADLPYRVALTVVLQKGGDW